MNLHGMVWTRWSSNPPPSFAFIWGLYELEGEKPIAGQACRRGCCFHTSFCDGMVPPTWWAPRSAETQKGEDHG